MQDDQTMASSQRSAAAMANPQQSAASRTFAIPELLEKIILDVLTIEAEMKTKKKKSMVITRPIILRNVSRDFHNTILGSPKIRNLCLPQLNRKIRIKGGRLYWLNDAESTWELFPGRAFGRNGYINIYVGMTDKLDDGNNAPWRDICLFDEDVKDLNVIFNVWFSRIEGVPGFKHLGALNMNETSTLGLVYRLLKKMRGVHELERSWSKLRGRKPR